MKKGAVGCGGSGGGGGGGCTTLSHKGHTGVAPHSQAREASGVKAGQGQSDDDAEQLGQVTTLQGTKAERDRGRATSA